jgi:adenine-specific DNA-methyltransferase
MPARTELIWEGKYDAKNNRVLPLRVKLPFQDVETVNESVLSRRTLFRAQQDDQPWRNRLIWGDKKYVLPALLEEFAGKVNLIYIDPPFDTGADFSFTAAVPDAPEDDDGDNLAFTKEPSVIEQKAYRDTWGRGLDSYLQWFYETVTILHELLAENGSIYVHLDWHVGHYAKAILDEVFGFVNFRNQIVWKRSAIATNVNLQWRNSHDILLFYSKSAESVFKVQHGEYTESSKGHYTKNDERGVFRAVPLMASGRRAGVSGEAWRGVAVASRGKNGMHWLKNPAELERLDSENLMYWNSEGIPELKYYLDEAKGVYVSDFWADITVINSMAKESMGYQTQKPEALLDRIIKASSNEDDLILDCFCGSGTTAAVAEKLGRRWIACDLGRFAIHTTRKRLLNIEGVKPFLVQNLGKYERQLWQA